LAQTLDGGRINNLDTTILTSALIMTVLTHPGIYNLIDGDKPVYSNSLGARRACSRFWLDLIVSRKPAFSSSIFQATEYSSEYAAQDKI
jgi:hypothetical protein